MTETLTLKATPIRLANDDTLAAISVLTLAHTAREGDLVALSRDFLLAEQEDIPQDRETRLWKLHAKKFITHRIAQVVPKFRLQAGFAHAMLSEDQTIAQPVMTATREWPAFEGFMHVRAIFVRGGIIVHKNVRELALGDSEGLEAQEHIETHMRVFVAEDMSNHGLVETIASLSAAASDVATWGTVERHLGAVDRKPIEPRKVAITL